MKKLISFLFQIAILASIVYLLYDYAFPWLKLHLGGHPKWHYYVGVGVWVVWKFFNPVKFILHENDHEVPVEYKDGVQLKGEFQTYPEAKIHALRHAKSFIDVAGGGVEMIQEGEDEWGQFFVLKASLQILKSTVEVFLIPYELPNLPERHGNKKTGHYK